MKKPFIITSITLCIFILSACAGKPIKLKAGSQPQKMELCVDFAREMSGEHKLLHLDAVNTFIGQYNAKDSHYQLAPCVTGEEKTVRLTIQSTRYVPPKEQAMYVLVSTLGVAYLVSGGGIGFAWFGTNTTTLGVTLSDDIASSNKTIYRHFSSSPYFKELKAVKNKHMKQFQAFMFELFEELEQSENMISQPQVAG